MASQILTEYFKLAFSLHALCKIVLHTLTSFLRLFTKKRGGKLIRYIHSFIKLHKLTQIVLERNSKNKELDE